MNKYLEGVLDRYVVATLSSPTTYLVFKDDNISFTKYISRATKTAGKNIANELKNDFYAYTGRTDIDLVVLPIRISYELIHEGSVIEGDEIGLLS